MIRDRGRFVIEDETRSMKGFVLDEMIDDLEISILFSGPAVIGYNVAKASKQTQRDASLFTLFCVS